MYAKIEKINQINVSISSGENKTPNLQKAAISVILSKMHQYNAHNKQIPKYYLLNVKMVGISLIRNVKNVIQIASNTLTLHVIVPNVNKILHILITRNVLIVKKMLMDKYYVLIVKKLAQVPNATNAIQKISQMTVYIHSEFHMIKI